MLVDVNRARSLEDEYPHIAADLWFSHLSRSQRCALLERSRAKAYKQGDRVYRIGDPPGGIYCVADGEVRLINYPDIGKQLLGLIVRAGGWFGELSSLDAGPRPHDAICVGPTTILRVSSLDVQALCRNDPLFYRDLALLSCAHQRTALERIALMWGGTSEARLSRLLVEFSIDDPEIGGAVVQITQEDMAGAVGVSRQRLNRLLKDLESQQLVRVAYGRVIVMDELRQRDVQNDTRPT